MSDADLFINTQRLVNANQSKVIVAKIENQTLLKDQLAIAAAANQGMRFEDAQVIEDLQIGLDVVTTHRDNLVKEVDYYKDLLAKPMHEIAAENEDFKKAYILQQQLLADWMVSQKAFKELAIDLGLQLGKTKEEVISQGKANEEKVLNNETQHNNNAQDSKIISPHIENLKNKIKK